jgi:hypothetical protein
MAAPHQQRAAASIEIALAERERLLDTQSGSPHDHDECAQPLAMRAVARGAHHGDDSSTLGRVGGVAQALVSRCVAGVEPRQRRWGSTSTGAVEQQLGHDPSSRLAKRSSTIRASPRMHDSGPAAALSLPTTSGAHRRSAPSVTRASEQHSSTTSFGPLETALGNKPLRARRGSVLVPSIQRNRPPSE